MKPVIKKGQWWKYKRGKTIFKITRKHNSKWHVINRHGNTHVLAPRTIYRDYDLLEPTDERVLAIKDFI